jgi:hypothetical protein
LGYVVGCVGDVELDGAAAARLEIDEHGAGAGIEQVAGVRFAVEDLFGGAAGLNRLL